MFTVLSHTAVANSELIEYMGTPEDNPVLIFEPPQLPDENEMPIKPIELLEEPQGYFYDTKGNGIVSKDIGVFEDGKYFFDSFDLIDTSELGLEQTIDRVEQSLANIDEKTNFIPGFRHEKFNVKLVDNNNNEKMFSLSVDEGKKQPAIISDTLSSNPTANAYVTTEIANQILDSDDKATVFKDAVNNKQIVVKGVGTLNSIKYGMINLLMEVQGIWDIILNKKTTTTTTTRHFIDGELVSESVSVEVKEESENFTIDSRPTQVRETLLTVKDCDDAKIKWEELKNVIRTSNCDKEKAELNKATQELNEAKASLDSAKLNSNSKIEELEEAKQDYINFFKNHLFRNDIKFEPQEGWNSMGLSGTDFTIYFNDDGTTLLNYIEDNNDAFGKAQKAFNDARRAAKEAKEELENAQKDHDTAKAAYDKAKAAYEECIKKRSDLEDEIKIFEEEWMDCVTTLKEQEEIKNGLAPRTLSDIQNAENFISGVSIDTTSKNPCDEAAEKRSEAQSAKSDAESRLQSAKSDYSRASKQLNEGNLEGSKDSLAKAQEKSKQAKEKGAEAKKLDREAKSLQAKCDRVAEQAEKDAATIEREDVKTGQEVKLATTTYYDTPQVVHKNHLKIGLYRDLKGEIDPCLDSCEDKLAKIAQDAAATVFSDMTFNLGIGVIKAPIDALSPGSLVGKVAQKITSHLLGAIAADDLSDYAIKSVTTEITGVMFPKLLGDDDLAGNANKYVGKGMDKMLQDEGVQTYQFKNEGKIWSKCSGWINCQGDTTMMYNPHTHYVVVLVTADCCPGILLIKYKVDKNGLREGPLTKKYIR